MTQIKAHRKLEKNVPSKLQLDGWWLDYTHRPFPKQVIAVKVNGEETGA